MKHEFCDHCPGCRPALLDVETMEPMPDDDPIMIAVNRIWDHETTYAMRKAFIEVTLHNSRQERDMLLANQIVSLISQVMKSREKMN